MFSTKSTRLASSLVGTVLRSSGSQCIILPRFEIRTENGGQLVAALRKSTVSLELSSYARFRVLIVSWVCNRLLEITVKIRARSIGQEKIEEGCKDMFSILCMHFFIAYQARITWRNLELTEHESNWIKFLLNHPSIFIKLFDITYNFIVLY